MAWQDLTTLYRGEPWFGPSTYFKGLNQGYVSRDPSSLLEMWGSKGKPLGPEDLGRLRGQYWTTDPKMAEGYGSKIRSMQVPPSELDRFKRFENRVTNIASGRFKHAGNPSKAYLVPKSTLRNISAGIDIGATAKHAAKNVNYPFKGLGDELRLLKAGWETMGDDYTVGDKMSRLGKNISNVGLGYLKNNALRALTTLGSLPGQALMMTLAPTTANADEVEWEKQLMRNISMRNKRATQKGIAQVAMQRRIQEAQAAQTGGGGGGPDISGGRDFQPQRPTRPGGFTDPGKGNYGPWKADGGIVDLYNYGGF